MGDGMNEILKMIEEVSPDDTAKLDEIDIRTHCWLRNREWGGWHVEGSDATGSWALHEGKRVENSYTNHSSFTRLTRDRNWLKLIRPHGWVTMIVEIDNGGGFILGWNCCLKNIQDKLVTSRPYTLPTEELAELHAIIQAIEYERSK